MYAVILAGGGGTRLWPLSTPECPKPFLRLLGDETLIQRTVARLTPLIAVQDVFVVTDRRYLSLVAEQLPAVPAANLIGEPVGRNTAAAVALAAEAIDRPGDETMLVLPADSHIADEAGFREALAAAEELASGGSLVTLGVTPDRPETGYGYVLALPPARQVRGRPTFAVDRFVEKPSADQAQELLATGLASWNAGIFAWTRAAIRDQLSRHAPDIVAPIRAICAGAGGAAARQNTALDGAYATLRATSIDYAVMEPASLAGAVAVVPIDVGWSDLGSWAALRDVWIAAAASGAGSDTLHSGSEGFGNRRDIGSQGSLVLAGGRFVATIGLRDVIVVDTPEALLVCAADRSQDVRQIAEEFARGVAGSTAAEAPARSLEVPEEGA
ncbi:MAG TPA: sugar phosphate nucleotidyltransferase [Candidatus Limnocylindrales bacterium]